MSAGNYTAKRFLLLFRQLSLSPTISRQLVFPQLSYPYSWLYIQLSSFDSCLSRQLVISPADLFILLPGVTGLTTSTPLLHLISGRHLGGTPTTALTSSMTESHICEWEYTWFPTVCRTAASSLFSWILPTVSPGVQVTGSGRVIPGSTGVNRCGTPGRTVPIS